MRKNIKYLISLVLLSVVFSCEQEEIMLYEQRAGVYFSSTTMSYSFLDAPETEVTVNIGVSITGDSVAYDREFQAIVVDDTLTTASSSMYKVLSGVIKAGEFSGSLPVELYYDAAMDDRTFTVELELIASEEFPEVELNSYNAVVSMSNTIIQPANWSWLKWYFGTYSTNWWIFIRETTGMSELPYYPTQSDTETWWMDVNTLKAYQGQVRYALAEYNAANPDNPLTHEDGDSVGQAVTMP